MNTPLSVILAADLPDALSEPEKSGTYFFGHSLDIGSICTPELNNSHLFCLIPIHNKNDAEVITTSASMLFKE